MTSGAIMEGSFVNWRKDLANEKGIETHRHIFGKVASLTVLPPDWTGSNTPLFALLDKSKGLSKYVAKRYTIADISYLGRETKGNQEFSDLLKPYTPAR